MMNIAGHTYPSFLVQGPLAGVSCAPFRRLTWEYGSPAFTYTEMISCKTLIHQSHESQRRFVYKDPDEGPLCFQLSANNPQELALGTRIAQDCGADLIDLNCGCPVKKIRGKKAGSFLLSQPTLIYQLITAMKQNTDKPVSIKIRVDAGSDDGFNEDIAKAVMDAGADFITVHGRHWTHGYDVDCAYDDIKFFVETLTIPVIGNGDVADLQSLKRMLETGCAGAMIARAGVGQPWLTRALQAQLAGETYTPPSLTETGAIFFRHVQDLVRLLNSEKFAIIQARTFAKYYAKRLSHREEFCNQLNLCDNLNDLDKLRQHYFHDYNIEIVAPCKVQY